jgi:hypothetical protein
MSYVAGCPVPLSTWLNESVADVSVVARTARSVVVLGGGTTGLVTVTLELPEWPEVVAVTVAEPAATAVTRPPELTVAIAALVVDHVTTWPDNTVP